MRTIKEILKEIDKYYNNPYKRNTISDELVDEIRNIFGDDRLIEICNAERDGRLVVLPCKVGDTIYVTIGHFNKKITESKVVRVWFNGFDYKVVCDGIGELTFGKSVFLTKEEAEQALKGGA